MSDAGRYRTCLYTDFLSAMNKLITVILFLLPAIVLPAQKRNTAYMEVLGNGLVLSANFERQMKKLPQLALHAGAGVGGEKPTIPVGVKYLFGLKDKKSFIETGVGVTLMERDLWDDNFNRNIDKNRYSPGIIPSIGYRYHAASGFMGRINYTPVFNEYKGLAFFGGIAMGWRF